MANESVAETPWAPDLSDVVLGAWTGSDVPGFLQHRMANLHRSIIGIRELSRMLAEDDAGRGQMDDGATFTPMSAQRRWSIQQAVQQLTHDAEFIVENLPDEFRKRIPR